MKRVAVALALVVAVASFAAEAEVRAFQLTYRPGADAVALVAPLLSATGSVVLQPQGNTLLIQDSAEVIERVAAVLRRWDVAPATFVVEIRLVRASNTALVRPPGPHFAPEVQEVVAATPLPVGPHLRTLEDELRELFRYRYFQVIGVVAVASTEGATIEHPVAGQYVVRYTLRTLPPSYRRVQLAGFRLLHGGTDGARPDERKPVFAGNVNLGMRQTAIIGAAPSEDSEEALVLTFKVRQDGSE